MKKKFTVLTLSALAMMALSGCSLSSGSLYYKIDIYSDYVGMEQDLQTLGHYRTDAAKLIGYCYATPNERANVRSILTYKDSEGKNYNYRTSSRTAPQGYQYVFNGFDGFYNDSKKIDQSKITSDCALFTLFNLEKREFTVTVNDAFGGIHEGFSNNLLYDTKVSDVSELEHALLNFPVHDDSGQRDPYYMTYQKKGWNVYIYNDDGKVIDEEGNLIEGENPVSDFIPLGEGFEDKVKNYVIKGETTFKAAYEEGVKKSYTVTFDYQLRETDHYDTTGKEIFTYSDMPSALVASLPTQQVVEYGKAIDETVLALNDYEVAGQGKDGNPQYYPDGSPKEGFVIDRTRILYDCHITILFKKADKVSVYFHGDLSNFDIIPENTSDYSYRLEDTETEKRAVKVGDGVVAPKLINEDPASLYKPTLAWSTVKFDPDVVDYEIFDLSSIQMNEARRWDLYPIMLPKEIHYESTVGALKTAVTLSIDVGLGGYLITDVNQFDYTAYNLDPTNPAEEVESFEFDDAGVAAMTFPLHFPYIGVRGFGAGAAHINKLTLSDKVTYLGHGEIAGLTIVEDVNLKATKLPSLYAYTFKNLTKLKKVSLPSSLMSVGTDQFANCKVVETVEIDLTSAEVAARDFAANWNSGYVVTYKAS